MITQFTDVCMRQRGSMCLGRSDTLKETAELRPEILVLVSEIQISFTCVAAMPKLFGIGGRHTLRYWALNNHTCDPLSWKCLTLAQNPNEMCTWVYQLKISKVTDSYIGLAPNRRKAITLTNIDHDFDVPSQSSEASHYWDKFVAQGNRFVVSYRKEWIKRWTF